MTEEPKEEEPHGVRYHFWTAMGAGLVGIVLLALNVDLLAYVAFAIAAYELVVTAIVQGTSEGRR